MHKGIHSHINLCRLQQEEAIVAASRADPKDFRRSQWFVGTLRDVRKDGEDSYVKTHTCNI